MIGPVTSDADLAALVERLREQFEAAGLSCETFETHISRVLLAGPFAYKFKKPLDLGFADFSTLPLRKRSCRREVGLNARYCPALYLDVVGVREVDGRLELGPGPEPIEYAVRMRRFATSELLDRLLARTDPGLDALLDGFAAELARLHREAAPAPEPDYGSPARIHAQSLEGLDVLAAAPWGEATVDRFAALLDEHSAAFARRHARGHVRDCHGDLHLANVVRLDGRLQAFDCIEFNDDLRYIDPMSDLAFLLMDLDRCEGAARANRFLNAYLQDSGDYDGLPVLRPYLVYRALVRAKVAAIALGAHPGSPELTARRGRHVALAARYLAERPLPGLVITHGLSGSGKTFHARRLAERHGFIHLRSDLERKRLVGLEPLARSDSPPGGGIYTPGHTAETYRRLQALARLALAAGYTVVVDASFLAAADRAAFRALADGRGVPFHILACSAPPEVLRERIIERRARGTDASEADLVVLERQQATEEHLSAAELELVVTPEQAMGGAGEKLGAGRLV